MEIVHVVLVLAAIVVVGRAISAALGVLRQPPVIGEVIAGILLGPSLLGRIAPGATAWLLPPDTARHLSVVAQAGVVLYMFVVGLELNLDRVRTRARSTIAISNAGIVVPFVLGLILSVYLYPRLSPPDVPYRSFALFIGVAMSITAFPVLARILADRGITDTDLGIVALTAAALDDVSAWCLLALVVGVAQANTASAAVVAALAAAYAAVMLIVVRPLVARAAAGPRGASPLTAILMLAGMLISAALTEWIGIHAIFGAFLFGALVPHETAPAVTLVRWMKTPVTLLLLPAFFAFAGMRTRIDLMSGAADWLTCALVIAVASAGKFGGCFAAARATGSSPRDAAVLGALMNTRGLMELIVLNIGLDLGVISPALFTMMVLMAVATTMASTPIVDLLLADGVRYNRRGS